jgi:hypothetical protein
MDAPVALAADYEVQGETALQAYEVASPWGASVLDRRRLMQTLGLRADNLQGAARPGEASYGIVLKLRVDADFGLNARVGGNAETDRATSDGARYVPGLEPAPLDLMYGYVEGRNLAHGWLGFRIGRQYVTDVLGWWSFDGALVRVTTPFYVKVEAYGGFEQRGGLPLSSSRYEAQGVWRGSHSGFGGDGQPRATDYPSFQEAQPAPAFGAALETAGPSWIHGRLTYRRVYNTGSSMTQQFPEPGGGYRVIKGTRLSQEKLGYAAEVSKASLGALKGSFAYDLYSQIVGSYTASAEAYLGQRATVGVDLDYYVPTFDADSIWNWFTHDPITTATGRATVQLTRRADVAASGGVRLWSAQGDPNTFGQGEVEACRAGLPSDACQSLDPASPSVKAFARAESRRESTSTLDVLANLSGRYRFGSGDIGARGMIQTGESGHRGGGELQGEKRLDGGRYAIGARASLYDWADPLRPDRDATSFGYVLGFGYRPAHVAKVRLEWEHDMNRLVGQRFRVVAMLDLLVMR